MRKTRFFLTKNIYLLFVLAWLLFLSNIVDREVKQQAAFQEKQQVKHEISPTPELKSKGNVTEEKPHEIRIRVLITDTGFQNQYHQNVKLTAGEKEYEWSAEDLKETVRIPEQKNGIRLLSIERQQGNPVYRGSMEIIPAEQGILLVNELPLEEYLKAVVPSEMPSFYEKEALKAQAVCARTYARKQMETCCMEEYNVHVDDSVNYQVYANIEPQASADEAVDETRNQILTWNGEPIEAYYFSTSAGVTSTDQIWGVEKASPYLKSVQCEFDSGEPWNRWKVSIPWETVAGRAEQTAEGKGTLVGLQVEKKNQSGAVTGLRVILEKGSFLLEDEYSVRQFLSPEGLEITEKNGQKTTGGSLLPSAYFQMQAIPGEMVQIDGGGYGHGVGMSQTAANEMAKEGYSCQEILDYFFANVEIKEE